jgi:hypothetical protein
MFMRTAVIGLAVALGAVLVPSGPAVAAYADAGKPTAVVSLGDSFISGEGGEWQGNSNDSGDGYLGTDRAYDPSTGTSDPRRVYGNTYGQCDRSDVAEVSPKSLPVKVDAYVNVACSGAQTNAIWTSFKGEAPQADQLAAAAKKYQVTTVVLSIGGNDLDVSGMLKTCGKDFMTWQSACTADGGVQQQLADGLKTMPSNVDLAIATIRRTMRDAGYPDGSYQFVVQGYPSTLPAAADIRYPGNKYDRYTTGGCPFYDADLDWFRGPLTTTVDDTLAMVVKKNPGVSYLDLRDMLAGREVCAKTSYLVAQDRPVSYVTSEWARFVGGSQGIEQEWLHPNAIAQQALGRCLGLFVLAYPVKPGQARCVNTPGEDPSGMKLS